MVSYRAYVWCSDNPTPPCDLMEGNLIIDGGQVTLHIAQVVTEKGMPTATATVDTSSDPNTPHGSNQKVHTRWWRHHVDGFRHDVLRREGPGRFLWRLRTRIGENQPFPRATLQFSLTLPSLSCSPSTLTFGSVCRARAGRRTLDHVQTWEAQLRRTMRDVAETALGSQGRH